MNNNANIILKYVLYENVKILDPFFFQYYEQFIIIRLNGKKNK